MVCVPAALIPWCNLLQIWCSDLLRQLLRFKFQLLRAVVCKMGYGNQRFTPMRLCDTLILPLQGSLTQSRRLCPLLDGRLQWLMNTMPSCEIKHGPWFLCHLAAMLLIVSWSSSSNTWPMVMWIVTKLDWLQMGISSDLASTMMTLLVMWSNP
jgi:hypothetical protein